MERWTDRFLSVAGALAVAGLLLAPAAAMAEQQPPAELPPEAWDAISGAIERDRYGAQADGDGALEASNPAQRYSARFTADGVTVSPKGASYQFELALTHAGFGDALAPVARALPRADGQRVEYVRGEITEWYENRPSGLEQGWTIAAPPGDSASGEPLRLALSVGGGLTPALAADGASVELRDGAGKTRLRYAGLAAWDAAGKELPVRLEVSGKQMVIAVEAAGAVYPITVDPTITSDRSGSNGHDRQHLPGRDRAAPGF